MNPFKIDGDLLPITSINRLFVDDQKAYDLFHSALIKESLIKCIRAYMTLENEDVTLSDLMTYVKTSGQIELIHEVNTIIKDYGHHLSLIIGTLFKPSQCSIQNHQEWSSSHWAYWASIKTLYLAGGAIIEPFIEPFNTEIAQELKRRNLSKDVHLLSQSEDLGMKGMASIYAKDGTLLMLDLGQTSIKRAILNVDEVSRDYIKLENIPSKYLFTHEQTEDAIIDSAKRLHQYLFNTIIHTITEHSIRPNTLFISVANYVRKGCFQPGKSSYGKLDFIARPYDIYLSLELSRRLEYSIDVRLFHDTSAMALNFINQKHTAIISVGTAFGVGFTEE